MTDQKIEVDTYLEYYVELPFNLSLPSGLYSLNVPKQIKIRRDMYYLQKGNELENPSTIEYQILPQDILFDNNGLVDKSYADYTYKRKMKTVVYIKYKIPFYLTIEKSEFKKKIINKALRIDDISLSPNTLRIFLLKYKKQLNEFLIYYANFYPINNIKHFTQHEIHPLSEYEFSTCHSGINLIIEDIGLQIPPIILDVVSHLRLPESTFISSDKTIELEKLVLNRKSISTLYFQEFFNLARYLYRTNKGLWFSNILINIMASFEAIFHTIEAVDKNFHPFYRKKKTGILNYYLNPHSKNLKSRKITIRAQRKLNRVLKKSGLSYKDSKLILIYLNYGRVIRNYLIHENIVRYNEKKDRIRFNIILGNRKMRFGILYKNLWSNLLRAYDVFNSHIMRLKYPQINWDIPSVYKKTHVATSTRKSEGKSVLVIYNYDWREIDFYNMEPPEFTVPPEKFPIGIKTKDNKIVNLNLDYSRGKYELVNQKYIEDDKFIAEWIIFSIDITYEEFVHQFENKTLNIVIDRTDQIYIFRSCQNCDFIIPIHRHIQYNNNRCPKCKQIFDLQEYERNAWKDLFVRALIDREYEDALKYGKFALKLDSDNPELWNDYGLANLKNNQSEKAIFCFKKSIELNPNLPDPYFNLGCTYSLSKNPKSAIDYLKKAIERNIEFKGKALKDPDFDNIKDLLEFKNLFKNIQ